MWYLNRLLAFKVWPRVLLKKNCEIKISWFRDSSSVLPNTSNSNNVFVCEILCTCEHILLYIIYRYVLFIYNINIIFIYNFSIWYIYIYIYSYNIYITLYIYIYIYVYITYFSYYEYSKIFLLFSSILAAYTLFYIYKQLQF